MTRNRLIILLMCAGAFFILSSNAGGFTAAEVASTAGTANGGCSCHGASVSSGSFLILIEDAIGSPVTKWKHGGFYKVKLQLFSSVSNSEAGMQSTVLDAAGGRIGDMSLLMPTQTQLDTTAAGIPFIHHNTDLVGPISMFSGSNEITTWEYTWVAPSVGSSNVTFYGVANDVDGNGTATGDQVFRSTSTLVYEAPASVSDLEASIQNMYPNPVTDELNIDLNAGIKGDINVHVFNLNGQCLRRSTEQGSSISIELGELNSGNYIISLENDGKTVTKPFTKF